MDNRRHKAFKSTVVFGAIGFFLLLGLGIAESTISEPKWLATTLDTLTSPSVLALLPIIYIAWAVPNKNDFFNLEDRLNQRMSRIENRIDKVDDKLDAHINNRDIH